MSRGVLKVGGARALTRVTLFRRRESTLSCDVRDGVPLFIFFYIGKLDLFASSLARSDRNFFLGRFGEKTNVANFLFELGEEEVLVEF